MPRQLRRQQVSLRSSYSSHFHLEENKLLLEEDSAEAQLFSSVAKSKQLAAQKKEQFKTFEGTTRSKYVVTLPAQLDEKTKQLKEKKQSVKLAEPSLLFSATTEFIRGIQSTQEVTVRYAFS